MRITGLVLIVLGMINGFYHPSPKDEGYTKKKRGTVAHLFQRYR